MDRIFSKVIRHGNRINEEYNDIYKILSGIRAQTLVLPHVIQEISIKLEEAFKNPISQSDSYHIANTLQLSFFDVIQASIKRRGSNRIPEEYFSCLLQFTELLEKCGDVKKEDVYLKTIINTKCKSSEKLEVIKMQAEYKLYLKRLKKEIAMGEETTETKEKIAQILKKDKNHVLDTGKLSEFEEYDLLKSYFYSAQTVGKTMKEILSEKNVELLAYTIFPPSIIESKENPEGSANGRESGDTHSGGYGLNLSAMKRLEFILNNFNVSNVLIGKENEEANGSSFYGSILFEIEDSDVVIVEDFYAGKPGKEKESYAKATYILDKEEAIKLIVSKTGRSKIKQDNKENKAFTSVNHTGDSYYTRLLEKYEMVKKAIEDRKNGIQTQENATETQQPNQDKNRKQGSTKAHVQEQTQSEKDNSRIKDQKDNGTDRSSTETQTDIETDVNRDEDNDNTTQENHSLDQDIVEDDIPKEYSEKEEEVANLIANLIKISSLEYSIKQVNRLHELMIEKMKSEDSKQIASKPDERTVKIENKLESPDGDEDPTGRD